MRAVPIEDDEPWGECTRLVIGPPVGHDITGDIRPVEALKELGRSGTMLHCKVKLEEGDIEKLQENGGVFWITQLSPVMVPWDVWIAD